MEMDEERKIQLSDVQKRMMDALFGTVSRAGLLGWDVFGLPKYQAKGYPAPDDYSRRYCRAAGRTLRSLEKIGLASIEFRKEGCYWRMTESGKAWWTRNKGKE